MQDHVHWHPRLENCVTKRREFSKAIRVEIVRRARLASGGWQTRCERCEGSATVFEIHHKDQDAMQVDKSRKLTADEGELLCIPCHAATTASQAHVLAKVKRIEAKHLAAQTPAQRPLQSRGFAKAEKPKREVKPAMKPRELFR